MQAYLTARSRARSSSCRTSSSTSSCRHAGVRCRVPVEKLGTELAQTRDISPGSLDGCPRSRSPATQAIALAAVALVAVFAAAHFLGGERRRAGARRRRRPTSPALTTPSAHVVERRRRRRPRRHRSSSSMSRAPCGGRGSTGCRRARGSPTRSRAPAVLTRHADPALVNLAAPLADGEQVLVPSRVPGASAAARCRGAGAFADGARRPEHGDRRAARCAAGSRAGDGAEDRRLPHPARAVHVGRRPRCDPRDRAGADRQPPRAGDRRERSGPHPLTSWPAALAAGLALANVGRLHGIALALLARLPALVAIARRFAGRPRSARSR